MALAESAANAAAKFASLSMMRQLGLMFGLAASITIGVAVILWSRQPDYMPLYTQLTPRDSSDVIDFLQHNGLPFKIDASHGTVLVLGSEVQMVRMKLAAEGLPRTNANPMESLSNSSSFTTSQFMENARYKQALETELARTISQFHDIKAARVHLAIPRESAFVRDSREPSASIFIDVHPGLEMKKQTIAAIVNLIASSIPNLSANRVTVVDQNGQLLSEGGGQSIFSHTERFMEYRQSLEQQYAQKIQEILAPFLGYGRVKAKVSADIDFTSFEQTQEMYNPDVSAVRSEQLLEEQRSSAGASGVPGSLSNTPPQNSQLQPPNRPAGGAPNQNNRNNQNVNNTPTQPQSTDSQKQSTRNYELDKTISHTQNQPGTIKRLTVAVLVDNRPVYDEKAKKMVSTPLKPEEIAQIKLLVADAIGYDSNRGDSLNVVNSNFVKPDPIEPIPEPHFWQKDGFWSIMKQVLGALFVLTMVFGIFRPLFKTLATPPDEKKEEDEQKALDQGARPELPAATDYEGQLAMLRHVVDKEPKRVAQVVKTWVDRG